MKRGHERVRDNGESNGHMICGLWSCWVKLPKRVRWKVRECSDGKLGSARKLEFEILEGV